MSTVICQLGELRGADGSCILNEGSQRTTVILQGPTAISHENEKKYRHIGHINLHTTSFHQDEPRVGDSFLLGLLEQCIDRKMYPRTEILIHSDVQDIHNEGVDFRSINASSLCLLDAAVRMNYYFAAVSVAHDGTNFTVHPDPRTLSTSRSVFVFVYKPSLLKPTLIGNCSHGQFSFDQQEEAAALAKRSALNTLDFIRNSIVNKLNKSLVSS